MLVPLCGKSVDLWWLAERGHQVVGVELAEQAVCAFFAERGVEPNRCGGSPPVFRIEQPPIELHCGDYFDLDVPPCDALYDRAALVALPPELRPRYAAHTDKLLRPGADRLLITFEYEQTTVAGPPYSVAADEVLGYWPELERIEEHEAIDDAPPKFRANGLTSLTEVVWRSP